MNISTSEAVFLFASIGLNIALILLAIGIKKGISNNKSVPYIKGFILSFLISTVVLLYFGFTSNTISSEDITNAFSILW